MLHLIAVRCIVAGCNMVCSLQRILRCCNILFCVATICTVLQRFSRLRRCSLHSRTFRISSAKSTTSVGSRNTDHRGLSTHCSDHMQLTTIQHTGHDPRRDRPVLSHAVMPLFAKWRSGLPHRGGLARQASRGADLCTVLNAAARPV